MAERRIGIRELKSRLSECVREAKAGGTIVVTEHGRAVARLVAEAQSLSERLETLTKAGGIQWSGRRLGRPDPVVRTRGRRTVADVLIENRE
jgi:prevent-host-death family protein